MDMNGELILIGAIVSLLGQYLKNKFGTTSTGSLLLIVSISIIAALIMYFVDMFGYTEAFLQILTTAGAFYAFIINNIGKGISLKSRLLK